MATTTLATAFPPETTTAPPLGRTARLPLWAAIAVAGAGGFVLDLATPAIGWWPLALVAVTMSLVSLIGRSALTAFLVGTVFGVVFFFTHLVWVGQFLGPVPWVALASLQAVLFGAGAIPITLAYRWTERYRSRGAVQLIAVPLLIGGLWATREVVMGSWPYGGFPWLRIGMTQVDGPLVQAVSWTGVTGLSLLIVALCAGILQWVRAGGIRFLRGIIPAAILTLVLVGTPQFPTTDAGTLRVGWVQGNGPAGYFDTKAPGEMLDVQAAASRPLLGQQMDLLVWPEGSVDADPLRTPTVATRLDRVVAEAGAPLLMNAATTRGADVFNTSLLWTADVDARQWHDKVNPVPFGEYVPDRWLYERIAPDLVGLIQREYTPGSNPPIVTVNDVGVGLAICFDVIYDQVIWDGARAGAELYVFQTNNADFRGTDENLQQLAFARMRAIETGRTVVNVSTVGTSEVIAPGGGTTDSVGVDTTAAEISTIPLRTGLTAAVFIGPWLTGLVPVLAAITLIGLGIQDRVRPLIPRKHAEPRRSTPL
ncbi:apolipoprotein N-acyltransferase [Microbacterium schleiferi]|uniref:apolipoprotein N-acyltransferase n=1 Tax=Microbacterium schleiferi TaxID=69362 RepID=UPI001D17915C|nr:apolipoprotein N-acyltransferase [Microbacterium schleiferi]MCC4268915.1 apolipoprotein N-acyltransferase [Microbacterium schleiferi]